MQDRSAPERVIASGAPPAIGPYSHAIVIGPLVFTSGQIALPPTGNPVLPATTEEQTHQVCRNLEAVLAAAGTSLSRVVKTTVFLTDMADFTTVNSIYETYFGLARPARSTVAVAMLPLGAKVEIEVVAAL